MNEDHSTLDRLFDPETREDEIARLDAESLARASEWSARLDAACADLERQDEDFHALEFTTSFECTGIPGYDDEPLSEESRIDLSELSEDDDHNARMAAMLEGEISAAIRPLNAHYRQLGLIRADNLGGATSGSDEASGTPTFYLVYRANDAAICPEALGDVIERRTELQAVPGATLTQRTIARPFNPTTLFNRAHEHGLRLGDWCREDASPELAPAPDESRDTWLGRVAMPDAGIQRNVTRWRRSGGNLDLFGAVGAANGDAARDKPIRWLIPGLIPRGYLCHSRLRCRRSRAMLPRIAVALGGTLPQTSCILRLFLIDRAARRSFRPCATGISQANAKTSRITSRRARCAISTLGRQSSTRASRGG